MAVLHGCKWARGSVLFTDMSYRMLILVLAAFSPTALQAQRFDFKPFPAGQTLMSQHPEWAKPNEQACFITDQYDTYTSPAKMQVSPTAISAHQFEKVTVRFDASFVCGGNTVTDKNGKAYQKGNGPLGYIEWEPGAKQDLPELAGTATYLTGYQQPASGVVRIVIEVQCAVPDAVHSCGTHTFEIPIEIVAPGAPLKTPQAKKAKK